MFKRKIYSKLVEWKKESDGRTALLVEGARRIGKSTIVKEFATNEYESFILIDFSVAPKAIRDLFDDVSSFDFTLVNALAIDMDWNNQIQCSVTQEKKIPCIPYGVNYAHENYKDYINIIHGGYFEKIKFNGKENTKVAKIGASFNRYDIVSDLGEENIRKEVTEGFENYISQGGESCGYTTEEFVNHYMEEIKGNYNIENISTDFYINDRDEAKVFAKDLKTYDDTTLQYVGIMPKKEDLTSYIKKLDAKTLLDIFTNLKEAKLSSFKEGVVTKIEGSIPFFKFEYELKLIEDLKELGIKDVFGSNADLSGMLKNASGEYIASATHKANIEFSNEGIKAAAATSMSGLGATACVTYDKLYDVPVETIDVTFDKPYVFFIRDKSTGEIWFTGTVYEGLTD